VKIHILTTGDVIINEKRKRKVDVILKKQMTAGETTFFINIYFMFSFWDY